MAKPKTVRAPFRLAFRAEGPFVNCYYAATDTMDGAMLLSSMRRSALSNTPGAFKKWQALMRDILTEASKNALGAEPVDYVTEPGPEHERGGNA